MRVAVYCRVACADQLSLDRQVTSVLAFAEKHGHEVVRCIADNGVSGMRNQASIAQLIDMAKRMQIEGVACQSPSSLTRDPMRFLSIETKLDIMAANCFFSHSMKTG